MKGLLQKIILLSSILITSTVSAQNQNPFELIPRIDPSSLDTNANPFDLQRTKENGNPFEIIAPPENTNINPPQILPPFPQNERPADVKQDRNARLLSGVIFFITALLTILVIFFRNYFDRVYRAFQNDNLLSQLYRDLARSGRFPYISLYTLFFTNAGLFIFLALRHFEIKLPNSGLNTLISMMGLVAALVILRHFILSVIAFVFPIDKELKIYSFSINIFNIIVGIVLFPFNLIIAFGPPVIGGIFIYLGFVVVILIYLFRSIRGLLIGNRYLSLYKFHFILYICTVELVPILALYKFFSTFL